MKKENQSKEPLSNFVKFSGIAIQIGLTIYLGSKLGEWLDAKYNNPNQLFTKICTLLAVFGSMFSVIKQVTKMSNKK